MLIYGLNLLLITIQGVFLFRNNTSQKNKKIFLIIVAIQLILISGLRGINVGTDTKVYTQMFYEIGNLAFIDLSNHWLEFGFVFLNKVIYMISDEVKFLFIVIAIIITINIFKIIYLESKNVFLSVYLYITLCYIYISFNAVRQFIAISIIILAYRAVLENKKLKFIILLMLATLFHSSSILFGLIYVFSKIKFTIKKASLLIIVTFVLTYSGIISRLIYFTDYAYYLDRTGFVINGSWSHVIIYGFIFGFGVIIKYLYKDRDKDNLLWWIILINLLIYICALKVMIVARLTYYFSIFSIIFIPNMIVKIKEKNIRFLIYILIMLMTLAYSILYLRQGGQGVVPYSV